MADSTARIKPHGVGTRPGVTSMDDWLGLQAKTWRQLAACTYLAIGTFELIGSAEAREALDAIRHILSTDWEGPS